MPRLQPLRRALLAALTTLLMIAAPARAADPPVVVPTISGGTAIDVTGTSATLAATIDPGGESAEYGFDYGPDTSYGQTTATVLLPTYLAGTVQVRISGLTPGVTYHFRAFAKNSVGTARGADGTFTTPAPAPGALPPTVAALPLTGVTTTTVTLNARVNPNGQDTTVRFEWGPTSTYGRATEAVAAGTGSDEVTRSATLGGLTPGTTYHARAVATSIGGTTVTKDFTFMPGRGLTKLVAEASAPSIRWGGTIGFEGRLHGAAANGVRLEILRQDHPYSGTWTRIATTGTLDDGTWGLRLNGIYTSTKLRARVIDEPTVYSNLVKLGAELQVPLVKGKLGSAAMQVRGAVFPVAKKAKITLQRYAGGGRWANVKPIRGKRSKSGRLTFKLSIPRGTSKQTYRAYVDPRDGAHAKTGSESVTVPKR